MPPKKESGTEMTRAQGQEMTRKIRARLRLSVQCISPRRGGTTASRTAAMTTTGV